MVFFQYAESSMNLEMVVREGFDSSPESLEMKQLCHQVSTIYCDRLRIPSSVSNIVFNFTTVASDYVLVSLKDDEVELGFEEQLKTCRESNADKLLKNEAFEKRLKELEASVLKLQGQAQLRAQPQAELQAKVADLEEQNTALKLQMDTIQLQIESLEPLISQLLVNVELQYNTRCRILVQEAQKRLLMKLGLEKEEGVKWEDFVKSLSSSEKVASGATEDMLQLMGTRMYTLNTVVHTVDSNVEMVHAVNNI